MKYKLNNIRKIHNDNELIFNKKCIDASVMNFNSEYEIISFTNLMNNELNTYPECVTSPDKQLHKTYDIDSLKVIPINRTIVVPPGNAFKKEENTDTDILFFYQSKSNDTYIIRKSTFSELHLPLPTVADIKYYDTTNDLLEVKNINNGIPDISPVDRYIYYTQKDVIVKFKYKDYIINQFKQQELQNESTSPFVDKDYKDTILDEYTKLTDQALYELSKIVLDETDPDLLPDTRKMALHVIRKSNPGITQEILDYNAKIINRKNCNESSEQVPDNTNIHNELSEKESTLSMNIHELFESINYKKDRPISALPELDIDKMMHDIKNEITVDNDTWAIFTCKTMDMNKPYEMSGAPADSESIAFDVYLGKLTVTTQGTYGYIYNRKTREQILCLKKDDYDKEIKRLFNIDMNSKADVPNIVVNENGYKVATSYTGKSYIANIPNDSNKPTTDVLESDMNNSSNRDDIEDAADDYKDDCMNAAEDNEDNIVNALKEKLNNIKLEEQSADNEPEEQQEVVYGGYNSDVSFMNAHDRMLREHAADVPEEYINHCNIEPKDVKTDSGSDVFAKYANMKFNVTPIPPEAEQEVHICEDIVQDESADNITDSTGNKPDSNTNDSLDKPKSIEENPDIIKTSSNQAAVNDSSVNDNGIVPGQVDVNVLDDEEYVKQELERDMSRINSMYNQRLINFNDLDIDSIVPKDENEKIVLDILKFKKERSYHPTYPNTYKDYSNFFFNDDFYDNLNDVLIDKIIHADLDVMDMAAFNEFITGLSDKEKWIVRTAKLCYLYTGLKLFNDDKSINEAAKIHTSDITNDTDNMFDEEGFLILVDYNMELARKHIVGGAKFLDKEECDMWIEEEKRIRKENEASAG
jgi:hypothetical protein